MNQREKKNMQPKKLKCLKGNSVNNRMDHLCVFHKANR